TTGTFEASGNNLFGTDPLLGTVVRPAGGVPYRPLRTGSPAIDAVTDFWGYYPTLLLDQRGLPRTVGPTIRTTNGLLDTPARDIGAVEYQYDLLVYGSVSPGSVAVGGNLTYTFTVQSQGPDTVGNAAVTVAVPANTTFVSLAPVGI